MNKFSRMAALIAVVLLLAWAGYVVSATTFSWSGPQQTGTLTYTSLTLANPTVTGTMTNTGASTITGALTAGTVTGTNGLTCSAGNVTLENGETIDNATDAEVRVTADDDAALLLEYALESDNAATNMADNDYMQISMTAYDSATNKQEYASIDLIATDVTTATEDSRVDINFLAGGAAKEVQVGASAAGAMAMTLPADMELSVDGKYAAVGSDATTGLMIQTGSCTNGQTITFSPAFGGTPRIVGSYSEDAGADTVIEFLVTSSTTSVVQAASAKTIDYIAIGARP